MSLQTLRFDYGGTENGAVVANTVALQWALMNTT